MKITLKDPQLAFSTASMLVFVFCCRWLHHGATSSASCHIQRWTSDSCSAPLKTPESNFQAFLSKKKILASNLPCVQLFMAWPKNISKLTVDWLLIKDYKLLIGLLFVILKLSHLVFGKDNCDKDKQIIDNLLLPLLLSNSWICNIDNKHFCITILFACLCLHHQINSLWSYLKIFSVSISGININRYFSKIWV